MLESTHQWRLLCPDMWNLNCFMNFYVNYQTLIMALDL
uniref:Uncharacterized protein n=1 Tax=Rhizophora mucronata TaxID=61149 RepID=A0A2P2NI45_RHIMU